MKIEVFKQHFDVVHEFFSRKSQFCVSQSLKYFSAAEFEKLFATERKTYQMIAAMFFDLKKNKKTDLNLVDCFHFAILISFRFYDSSRLKKLVLEEEGKGYKTVLAHYRAIYNLLFEELKTSSKLDFFSLQTLFPIMDPAVFLKPKTVSFENFASPFAFKRTQSLFNLNDLSKSTRENGSQLRFSHPSKIMKRLYHEKQDETLSHFLLTLEREFVAGLVELPPGSRQRQQYFRLRSLTYPAIRSLLDRMLDMPDFKKKMRFRELITLEDFAHFNRIIDPEENKLSKQLELDDITFLSKNFPETFPSDLDSLSTFSDYKKFKKTLTEKYRTASLSNEDKQRLENILQFKLKIPRMFYLESRLERSVNLRLGNQFLIHFIEDRLRPIFLRYVDPNLVDEVDFHFFNARLIPRIDYTEIFCSRLIAVCFRTGHSLTLEKRRALITECRKIEAQSREHYDELYRKEIQHIPARLIFEKEILDNMLKPLYGCFYRDLDSIKSTKKALVASLNFEQLTEIIQFIQYRTKVSQSPQSHGFMMDAFDAVLSKFHLTLHAEDPFNLYYIEFSRRISKAINHLQPPKSPSFELDLILFGPPAFQCLNLEYAEKNLRDLYDETLVTDVAYKMYRPYFLNHPQNLLRGRIFHEPEFFGLYCGSGNKIYSILGLLLVNKAHVQLNDRKVLVLSIPNPSLFQRLKTIDADTDQMRALNLSEMAHFWTQEYRFKTQISARSFPLYVLENGREKWFPSFKHLLNTYVVSHWHDLGAPDWSLILELIQAYLLTDPLVNTIQCKTEIVKDWEDRLIYFNPDQKNRISRPIEPIYALYGQLIDNKIYLFELLARLMKNLKYLDQLRQDKTLREQLNKANKASSIIAHVTDVIDELMTILTSWYLTPRPDELTISLNKRLDNFRHLYLSAYARQEQSNELYFNRSNTRYEKLAKALSLRGKLPKNYRKFMIPTLELDHEIISYEDVTTIPFEHAILSENGKELYDLRLSVMRFKETRRFINEARNQPFTEVERRRIKAHPEYYKAYWIEIETAEEARQREKDQKERLLSKMINAIRQFIDGTHLLHDEIGAQVANNKTVQHEEITITPECYARYMHHNDPQYDDLILLILHKRIDKFIFGFYHQLPPQEKVLFDNYYVYDAQNRRNVRLSEIITRFTDPSLENRKSNYCLSASTELFFRVVVTYDRTIRFRDFIEMGKTDLGRLRREGPRLECCDPQNSPVLYRLKMALFRLKVSSHLPESLYQNVEKRLEMIPLDKGDLDLDALHEELKTHVSSAFQAVSKEINEHSFFKPSRELLEKRSNLSRVNRILQTQTTFDDDTMVFYRLSFLISHLRNYLLLKKETAPTSLNLVYRSLLKKSASKYAYVYANALDKESSDLKELVALHQELDITSKKTITEKPTHMLEVNFNVEWERYLQTLSDETLSKKLRNYLATLARRDPSGIVDVPKCK